MKAAVFHGSGRPLQIEEKPVPQPAPEHLLVRVRYCGICGTDLHASETMTAPPAGLVLGHEYVGEIAAVGAAVQGRWQVGDPVCALPFLTCGKCAACAAGRPFECAQQRTTGLDVPGGFAEYVETRADQTLALPPGLPLQRAVLIEPLAVGWHALEQAQLQRTDRVVVIGAGPIGLAIVFWCRYLGLDEIVVLESNANRRQLALTLGATAAHAPQGGAANTLLQYDYRPTVLFECVGKPGIIQQCIDAAPRRARIAVVGFCTEQDQFVPAAALIKELTFHFAIAYTRADFEHTIRALEHNGEHAAAMITDVVGFDGLAKAFEALKQPSSQCKVVLQP